MLAEAGAVGYPEHDLVIEPVEDRYRPGLYCGRTMGGLQVDIDGIDTFPRGRLGHLEARLGQVRRQFFDIADRQRARHLHRQDESRVPSDDAGGARHPPADSPGQVHIDSSWKSGRPLDLLRKRIWCCRHRGECGRGASGRTEDLADGGLEGSDGCGSIVGYCRRLDGQITL